MKHNNPIEILAPAGDFDSVLAAVRSGADAIYLGGTRLNARKGASTFDLPLLKKTVAYCHARNVAVHLTLNTIVFDDEIPQAVLSIQEAAAAGVDALIVQDLAVARLVQTHAPTLPLHGSTQLSVHNLAGVQALAALGFQRAVIARELSLSELEYLAKHSPIEIETFVHGALCMSISGQCYLSGMIGGRSGNRGRCAQPCRLPFASEESTHALSLKDLSHIQYLPVFAELGIASLKIEGRLKRPEYVAASVTACVDARAGKTPDYDTLQAVFSRSGFTDGYATGALGDSMFGTRTRRDVVSAQDTFTALAQLYHQEVPLVPITMELRAAKDTPVSLTVKDTDGREITVTGAPPEIARTTPTTEGRARAALERTGGTPFDPVEILCHIEDGLMLPASVMNQLRRQALDQLLEQRSQLTPHPFHEATLPVPKERAATTETPEHRIRIGSLEQLTPTLAERARWIIVPQELLGPALYSQAEPYLHKIMVEQQRIAFDPVSVQALQQAQARGIVNLLVTNLSGITLGHNLGFLLHGDFTLNTVNRMAVEEYRRHGVLSMTMSLEYGFAQADTRQPIPWGIVAYGWMPLMIFRNHPAGLHGQDGFLTDRMGIQFYVQRQKEASVLYNSVPLTLADRGQQLQELAPDFITFYFTHETPAECEKVLADFAQGTTPAYDFTRGMYQPRVQ